MDERIEGARAKRRERALNVLLLRMGAREQVRSNGGQDPWGRNTQRYIAAPHV